MQNCKIIEYTEEWRDPLRKYMRKIFRRYSDSYIEYCLDHSLEKTPSLIVVNEDDKVVGCHLYYCCKALVNGDEVETQWGHDTYLDEEYRSEIGLDFMLIIQSIRGFGLGLTHVADKIQKKLKNVFFDGVYNYYMINHTVLLSPFQKLLKLRPKLYGRDEIMVGNNCFKRIQDAREIVIPDKGYWFKNTRDIDFIRDEAFLNDRFIHNIVNDYQVYAFNSPPLSCYFVVRLAFYRGMPALTLCDYRYCGDNVYILSIIIKAVKRIARKSNLGIVFFLSGDMNMQKALKGSFYYKTPVGFMTSRKAKTDMTFIVTGGDSDADFLK